MNDLVPLNHNFEEKKFSWKSSTAAPVGAALLLVALGWGAGAKVDALRAASPEQIAAAASAKAVAESADTIARVEQAHKQEIADLRAQLDGLKGQLDAQAAKTRGSEAAVAALQKSLAEEKAQAHALHARLEKLQQPAASPAPAAAPAPVSTREPTREAKAQPDRAPAASPGPKAAVKPAPKRYGGYVLRDVNDGVAMVEGADGMEEVIPGDLLQGGARVQRLEKRGGDWVVLTDRGYIAPGGDW